MIRARKAPSILRHCSPASLQQRRTVLLPLIPIVVVGGATAFAYITWSQVQEKRREREAEAALGAKSPEPSAEAEKEKSGRS